MDEDRRGAVMCLDEVLEGRDERFTKRPKETVRRFKVVSKDGTPPYFPTARITRAWSRAMVTDITYSYLFPDPDEMDTYTYLSGFHVFKTREECEIWMAEHWGAKNSNYKIVVVECAGLLASGLQQVIYIDNEYVSEDCDAYTETEVYQWIKLP